MRILVVFTFLLALGGLLLGCDKDGATTQLNSYRWIAVDKATLRKGPSTSTEKIKVLPKDTKIYVISEHGNVINLGNRTGRWVKIKQGTLEGYVFGGLLKKNKSSDLAVKNHPDNKLQSTNNPSSVKQQSTSQPKGYRAAKSLLKEKKYKQAIDACREDAINGDPKCQNYLGFSYLHGKGVEKNSSQAKVWLEKSDSKGNPKAPYNLARMYHLGMGVTENYKEAVRWYSISAERGFAQAQYMLAAIYNMGAIVPKDKNKAIQLLNLAVAQGHSKSKKLLIDVKRGPWHEFTKDSFEEYLKAIIDLAADEVSSATESIKKDPYESGREHWDRRNTAKREAISGLRGFYEKKSATFQVDIPIKKVEYRPEYNGRVWLHHTEVKVPRINEEPLGGGGNVSVPRLLLICSPIFSIRQGGLSFINSTYTNGLINIPRSTARQYDVLANKGVLRATFKFIPAEVEMLNNREEKKRTPIEQLSALVLEKCEWIIKDSVVWNWNGRASFIEPVDSVYYVAGKLVK